MKLRRSPIAYVALVLLAASCDNPQSPNDSAITGSDAVGQIVVTIATTGDDIDNSYALLVDSTLTRRAGDGIFTIRETAGVTTVELSEIAGNCVADGPTLVSVTVKRSGTVNVSFRVKCYKTGFQVTVHTAGQDTPPFYALQINGLIKRSLRPNDVAVVSRLDPGPYSIRLESPIGTCTPKSSGELKVDLPPRTVVPVTFEVECAPPVRLEKIAYSIDSTYNSVPTSYLGMVRPDGTQESVIGAGGAPSWSPNGRQLAYAAECGDDSYYSYYCTNSVAVIDPETLSGWSANPGSMPAWSPNGDVIAFVSTDGSLAIAPSAGGPSSRVSLPQGLHASDPSWSPDSQSLAFGCNATNEFTRLCIVKRDGTGFRQLTDPTSDPAYHPAWSRDGNTIVFTSVSVVRSSIAVMPAAGGAIQILTEGFDPAWSRDGTKLVFARSDGLFTMNSDGSNVQRLTTGKHRAPAWRP